MTIRMAMTLNILTKDMLWLKYLINPWQVGMNSLEIRSIRGLSFHLLEPDHPEV